MRLIRNSQTARGCSSARQEGTHRRGAEDAEGIQTRRAAGGQPLAPGSGAGVELQSTLPAQRPPAKPGANECPLPSTSCLLQEKHHSPVSWASEILSFNGFFVALFLGSAWLFRNAAQQRTLAGAGPEFRG